MAQERLFSEVVNTNPMAFEELATSLASLASYAEQGDMGLPFERFEELFRQALQQPPNYAEITELAGLNITAGDRRAGRGAWLLMNIENLEVYGVHSLVWHKVGKTYYAPLLDQVGKALGTESQLSHGDLQAMGKDDTTLLDVLGIKDNTIWLVQTLRERRSVDSAVLRTKRAAPRLFRGTVFEGVQLTGDALDALFNVFDIMGRAFPNSRVAAFALVMHPDRPDFELYGVDVPKKRPDSIVLVEGAIKRNSIDFEEQLARDHEALWTLGTRLDNDLFRGLPPCRGGRTLSLLASAAKRQKAASSLLEWKQGDFIQILSDDFNYTVPRDKVRHDLDDRLVGQGFMRKWGGGYSLMVKGIARYEYCLAKYTTKGSGDPMQVLDACIAHRNRIIERHGCL